MPRPRRSPATLDDAEAEAQLSGELDQDPTPAPVKRGPGRPRKATGNAGKIAARGSDGKIMSEAAMIAKVRDELYLWLSMAVGAWEFRDPECASLLLEPVNVAGRQTERLAAITDRLVAIVARNKTLLAVMAKSGVVGDVAALGTLMLPVVRAVWATHGPTGRGHGDGDGGSDVDGYAPYAG